MKPHSNTFSNFLQTTYYLLLTTFFLLLFLSPSSARAAVIQKPPTNLGLVGYWTFNEGSGIIAHDFSGNGDNGTLSGTTTPSWVSGKHAGAVSLNGVDNFIQASPVTTGSNFSISLLINRKGATNTFAPLVEQGGTQRFRLVRDGNRFCFGNDSITDNFYCTANIFSDTNSWYYIVAYYNGADHIFVNNIEYSLTQITGSYASWGTNQLNIGYRPYTGIVGPFNGYIDDVRIYNRALSTTEVQNLYLSGSVKRIVPNKLGLVGFWPFDEGNGNIAHDFSGNSNSGTLSGTTLPSWTNGRHGLSLNFDGTSSYINITNSSTTDITVSSASVSLWLKTTTSSQSRLFSKRIGGASPFSGYELYLNGSGQPVITADDGISVFKESVGGNTVNDGKWHHVVGLVDKNSNTLYVYVDGQLSGTPTSFSGYGSLANSSNAHIGNSSTCGCNFFNGAIDDVRVFSRALSAAEISTLYKSGEVKVNAPQNTKITTGLIGLWTFNGPDVSGITVNDVSGNGNNGTTTGAKLAIGKVGQAMKFNGSSDFIAVSTSPASILNISGNQITESAWIFPTGYSANSTIATRSGGYYFQLHSDGTLATYQYGTTPAGYQYSTSTVPLNKWSYVAYTYNGSNLIFYINGAASGTIGKTGNIAQLGSYPNEPFRIGWDGSAGVRYFKGSIDEVRIYNRALSPAEISQLYLMGK